jgi:hypothetical protein
MSFYEHYPRDSKAIVHMRTMFEISMFIFILKQLSILDTYGHEHAETVSEMARSISGYTD